MKRRVSKREKAILRRKNSKMSLKNTRVAVHWKDLKGNRHSKIYPNLADAEYARKYLIKNGAAPEDIELAIVPPDPKPTAEQF